MRDLHCTINELLSSNNDVVDLRFWRQGTSHNFSHISPIMEVAGFQFEYVMIDTLHTIDLGVGPRLAGVALQRILLHGKRFQNDSSELGMTLGCSKLTAALARWKTGPGVAQRLRKSYNFKVFKFKNSKQGAFESEGHAMSRPPSICTMAFDVQKVQGRAAPPASAESHFKLVPSAGLHAERKFQPRSLRCIARGSASFQREGFRALASEVSHVSPLGAALHESRQP